MRKTAIILSAVLLIAANGKPAEDIRIRALEERYAENIRKIESTAMNAKAVEAEKLIKGFKDLQRTVTKAGDFDMAQLLKEKLDAFTATGAKPRPKDTVEFKGHHYALIKEPSTWHVAKRRCEEMGGHLVTFDSSEEQVFIFSLCSRSDSGAWIGASNEGKIDRWEWVTGTPVIDMSAWQMDDQGREFFSRGVAYWPDSKSFNDHNLGAHIAYLCEWND